VFTIPKRLRIYFRFERRLLGGIGVVIGLVGTVNVALAMRHLLYGVSPLNPLHLAGGALLVLMIALLAGHLPARRAARLDPMEALRCE
jgi:putative ABC transport system permease protein